MSGRVVIRSSGRVVVRLGAVPVSVGGQGVSDHAELDNLSWTLSGHTVAAGSGTRLGGWGADGLPLVVSIGTSAGTVAAGDHTHSGYEASGTAASAVAAHEAAGDPHPGYLREAAAVDLLAIEALTGTGVARRTGDGVWTLDTTGATGLALLGAASASAARSTLGLGGAAVLDVGTGAGQVAGGDHAHSGVYQPLSGELSAIAALAGLGALHRTADDTVVTRTLQWVTLHDTPVTGVGPFTYTAHADDVLVAGGGAGAGGSGGSGALQGGVTTRTGGTGGQGGEAGWVFALPSEADGWVGVEGAGGPAKAGRSGSDGDGVSGDAGGTTTFGPYRWRGGSGGWAAISGSNRQGGGLGTIPAVSAVRLHTRINAGNIVGSTGDIEAPPAAGCGGASLLGSSAYGGHDGGPFGGPGGGGGGGLAAGTGAAGGAGGTVGTTPRPAGGAGGTTGGAGTDGGAVAGSLVGTGGGGGGGNHTGSGGDGGDGSWGAGGGGGGSGRSGKGGGSGKGGEGRLIVRVLRWVTT